MSRYVILTGCVIVAAMVLFPPYEGVYLGTTGDHIAFMGYYSFFAPPDPKAVYERIQGQSLTEWSKWETTGFSVYRSQARYTCRLDSTRLTAQLAAIVLITCGLAFALRPKGRKDTGSTAGVTGKGEV